ncbi:MAG: Macrolide export ATP-binding/permease protein MacB [Parcubacteria group bacterium ADurb.Bin326]|nr:MAG: Macrolide export ATP-binding/permease protein MacB [Parcubacteria group bacterium ADurb.Bin326]
MLTLNIAIKSLTKSKLRTFLTVVGIVIGIAAVIIVMSAGEGLKGQITDQLDAFGTNIIQIEPKVPSTSHVSSENAMAQAQGVQITTLTKEDGEAIGKLKNVANHYAALVDQEIITYLDANKVITVIGTESSFIDMDKSEVAQGRFFNPDEENDLSRVAVLGNKLARTLFGNQDPVGQQVKIGQTQFKVVGVLQERGNTFGFDFDNIAYLPLTTLQKIVMGVDHVQWITAQMKNPSLEQETADDIIQLLRDRHEISDSKYDDFAVMTMTEMRDMIDTIFNAITLLLIALAGISLLVGGVGIMNIMYVSVSERTFEIGLRKAVGAKKTQVLWQFLFEAIIVTLLGGVVGIAIGLFISWLVSFIAGQLGFSWSFVLPPESIAIAFGFCGAVGLIFGYYPAKQAAEMDVISALRRHE